MVKKTPWLLSCAQEHITRRRRFQIQPQQAKNEFIIEVLPGFAHECDPFSGQVPQAVKGIYCYYSANGDILYIGQGVIARRYTQHRQLKDIPAKTFRWTEVADDKARKLAEAHHLRAYFDRHGNLPPFNQNQPYVRD